MAVLTIKLDDRQEEVDTHKTDRNHSITEAVLRSRVLRRPKHFVVGSKGRFPGGEQYEIAGVASPLFAEGEVLYRNDSMTDDPDKTERVEITSRTEIGNCGGYIYSYIYHEEECRNVAEAKLLELLTIL